MAATRFTSSSEENITQLLNGKDSENTKKFTKHHRLIFESYLKEKNQKSFNCSGVSGSFTKVLRRGEKERCTQRTPFVPSDLLCVDTSNKN